MTPALLLLASAGYDYILSGSAADVQPRTRPGYLLAGGGGSDDASHRWFLDRAGHGDIVVLRASGSDGYHPYFAELAPVDSIETLIFRDASAADDPFVIERLRRAEGIFLAGGDQWNYVRFWKGRAVAREINAAIARGVPVGGTSAGLAVLGQFVFAAEHDTVTSAQALANPLDPKVSLVDDFLRIPALNCLITDSHFSRRDRMGRLLVFVSRLRAENRACASITGLGIDEGTSVMVEADGSARVSGRGSAWWVRLDQTAEVPEMAVTRRAAGQPDANYRLTVAKGKIEGNVYGR